MRNNPPSRPISSLVNFSNIALSKEQEKLQNYRIKMEDCLEALQNTSILTDPEDHRQKEKEYKKAQSEFVMQQASYREIERASFKIKAQLKLNNLRNHSSLGLN